ncbi:MAG: hypothetical protein KJ571_12580 [Bacteroidetes bacterium]|nr:hypothetical protein [Bacteroidota bacterium]
MKLLFILISLIHFTENYAFEYLSDAGITTTPTIVNDSTDIANEMTEKNYKDYYSPVNPLYLNIPFYSNEILLPKDFISNSYLFNSLENVNDKESNFGLEKSKLQLSKAMLMNYSFIKKNELGTFGKIIGTAAGISAVGLGVYHLIKYKEEYFK